MKILDRKLSILFLLLFIPLGAGQLEAYIVESGPSEVQNMIYTWGDSQTTPYYQDAQSYPDIGVMICDSSGDVRTNYYTGVQYSLGDKEQLVSYGTEANLEIANDAVMFNGRVCKMTSIGGLTVSPSVISGDPETKIAALPAEVSVIAAENSDGSNSTVLDTGSELSGSYSGGLSYSYSDNTLDLDINSITVESNIGSRSFNPDEAGRGISASRPLIVGVCSDSSGDTCNSLTEIKNGSSFPEEFSLDLSSSQVNDQNVYTRYALANGKKFAQVDIGSDIGIQGPYVSRNTVYYSQNQSISFSVVNRGNVPIETDFDVSTSIKRNGKTYSSRSFTVADDMSSGESKSFSYDWRALEESGTYTVNIEADTENDVAEINEMTSSSTSFDLESVGFPEVYVDGERKLQGETVFESPGIPYNLTIVMKNSDNRTLENAEIKVTEIGGMSNLVPHQKLNDGSFTDMKKISTFRSDENGTATLTFIPTGNVLLSDRYNETDIQDSITYSLRFSATYNGQDVTFIVDGSPTNTYPLEVKNPGLVGDKDNKELPNLNEYAKPVMNGIYTIFSSFWKVVT